VQHPLLLPTLLFIVITVNDLHSGAATGVVVHLRTMQFSEFLSKKSSRFHSGAATGVVVHLHIMQFSEF
jgi:hypothetical protein